MSFLRRLFSGESNPPAASPPATRGTIRHGKAVPADAAFDAWTSDDLNQMLGALNTQTHPVDRHFLLMGIVSQTYKLRAQMDMASLCVRVGRMHLNEFPQLAPALRRQFSGVLPRVTTFQHLATVLAEQGDHAGAVAVCEQAVKYGLSDGTKGGFATRIEKIKRRAGGK